MSTANNETGARAIGAMLKAKGEGFVRKLKEQNLRPHGDDGRGIGRPDNFRRGAAFVHDGANQFDSACRDQRRAGRLGAHGSRGGERRQHRCLGERA